MASSDVDQKFLGKFAQQTETHEPYLSQQLYKILGLSVLLSKKLFRARRLRRLDTTRDTKSLQLYHHIIWLSREGLVILEVAVLPAVFSPRMRLPDLAEMRVLAQKLQGSFYHIFVLFHNQPSINRAAAIPPAPFTRRSSSIRKTVALSVPSDDDDDDDDPYALLSPTSAAPPSLPPGLAPIAIPKPTASFLLPATDYIPNASTAFDRSMKLARDLLGGSHPLRLSVAVEYCAYLYDCLHDGDSSRSLAKVTIRNVYSADEGMDDETFADSANLVSVLGKMMRRGLSREGAAGSERGTSAGRSERTGSSPRGKGSAAPGSTSDYPRPLQPHGHAHPASGSRTHPPSSPRTNRERSATAGASSPQRVQQYQHQHQQPQTHPQSPGGSLADSWWPPTATGTHAPSPRADRERSSSHSYSPLQQPRMPAASAANLSPKSPRSERSPRSPGGQKLPKMTPWEPPSPETRRTNTKAVDSPPRIRGGGAAAREVQEPAPFVRRNASEGKTEGRTQGKANGVGRTLTPDEVKEEKRRRVEVAERKSRSSEGLKRRGGGSGSGSGKTKTRSREKLETALSSSASAGGRSRRKR